MQPKSCHILRLAGIVPAVRCVETLDAPAASAHKSREMIATNETGFFIAGGRINLC